ncbi:MAG TPA: DUF2330 domain-containing protein [Vicinamibacteria bacterium]|nr:DUF2330 domain-containing protein [Vicinamibacteria bacterium]
MQRSWPILAGSLLLALCADPAFAFCGFYVAKADTKLFNRASQVAIVREGDRTVMTLSNDFQGDPTEFAMVIPVPVVVKREQIAVAEKALLDHLDAYSSPRLVEYHDPDPCTRDRFDGLRALGYLAPPASAAKMQDARSLSLGVTIEAKYTVGEFDILILSATQSGGLETWLRENGYRIPRGASEVLGSYIRQQMRFFVARVNLKEQARLGFTYLRPLQVSYESPKFMLPIRLGTVNADGPQELFVFTLTREGRVETTNYRTVRLPSDVDVPTYVKEEFGPFYKAMFAEQVRREDMSVVFTEYAWDMGWCDPCAADPLSADELRRLGVSWVGNDTSGGSNVFLTRLHVRYDGAHFPQDLVFQQTGDRQNFQGRYVMHHPWTGEASCSEGDAYRRAVSQRMEREAQNLAHLTGWSVEQVRRRAGLQPVPHATQVRPERKTWWDRLWDW